MIRAASFVALLLLACACGQKGVLRLPEAKKAATPGTAPVVPPQPTPAAPGPAAEPPSS